jgi:hypothetical protein
MPDSDLSESQKWVFEQLLRTESHWTSQRQNQQARVATTLTVTGVMLTLLAPLAVDGGGIRLPGWAHIVLIVSVVALGLDLLPGVAALWPRTEPSEDNYISTKYFLKFKAEYFDCEGDESLVDSFPTATDAANTIRYRRRLIQCQLGLLVVASVLLVVTFTSAI